MDLYAENILDHYKSPRHKQSLSEASITHGEKNLSCGDTLTLQLQMKDGVITAIGWEGNGCAISQAGMSMLSEELIGMKVSNASVLKANALLEMLGVSIGPRRMKCALLALHTLKNALCAMEGKPGQLWRETVGTDET